MKPILLSLLLLFAVPVCAALPPVFPAEAVEKSQADLRTTTYLSPVRVMWIQNEEPVSYTHLDVYKRQLSASLISE